MTKYLKLQHCPGTPLLPSSLPLGRLVLDVHKPTQGFRDLTIDNSNATQTSTNLSYRFIVDKKRNDSLCSPIICAHRTSHYNKTLIVTASQQKTYTLDDSEKLIKSALSRDVMDWLLKRAWGFQSVYIIVGLCTLINSCVEESKECSSNTTIHFYNPLPLVPPYPSVVLDHSRFSKPPLSLSTQPSNASSIMFQRKIPEETVFAVQYRQIFCYKLFGRVGALNINISHQLPNSNEWEVLLTRSGISIGDAAIRTHEGEKLKPVHQAKSNGLEPSSASSMQG